MKPAALMDWEDRRLVFPHSSAPSERSAMMKPDAADLNHLRWEMIRAVER